MKKLLTTLIVTLMCLPLVAQGGEPFCHVRHYDEFDGLSSRGVKQIVEDREGYLWFATWNGLNRFNGYTFETIRPHTSDKTSSFSDRIGDIKVNSEGNLWCRIDDKLLMFDVRTYRFHDLTAALADRFGGDIRVKKILTSAEGKTVLAFHDGRFITFTDSVGIASASESDTQPDLTYPSPGNRRLGDVGPFRNADLIYSRTDSTGTAWIITRGGEVFSAPSLGVQLTKVADLNITANALAYSTTDSRGNVWLRNSDGAYCLTMGHLPYTLLNQEKISAVKGWMRDSEGRVWVAETGNRALAVYTDLNSRPKYLGSDGRFYDSFVTFGARIYSITTAPGGNIWISSKPEGLFRLTPLADGSYRVENFVKNSAEPSLGPAHNDIHHTVFDSQGRMWIALISSGVDCVTDPQAEVPRFVHLGSHPGFPQEGRRVRQLAVVGDTMLLGSTTGGLLTYRLPAGNDFSNPEFRLHVSEAGRESSLGNIAVARTFPISGGRIVVATETDGVNMLPEHSDLSAESLDFIRFNTSAGIPADVTSAVAPDPDSDRLLVVSGVMVYQLDPATGSTRSYPTSFWHKRLHFGDAPPLPLGGGRWLIGLDEGAVCADLSKGTEQTAVPPIVFTSVSLQNRPDSLLSALTDTLVLSPSERNITIHFAALDYGASEDLRYRFTLDDGAPNDLRTNRSVTLLELKPRTYTLRVRSSDSSGRWLDNDRTLTIIVTPTFWETPFALFLYIVAAVAVIAAVIYTIIYIRRMRRKQHELLEAYLRLIEESVPAAPASPLNPGSQTAPQPASPTRRLSADDEAFMDRVLRFVNDNLGNPDATIDEMAAATATSRSSLNRRLKTLLGVTPADFLKESRINRAASLLTETDRTVKEIALGCGFSDLNYFSKCFKSARSATPSAYRHAHRAES